MRAPTPSPDAIALEAATTFLHSCVAINWYGASNPAGVSLFLPKRGREKLDRLYRKNFARLFAMARKGDAEIDYYLRQELLGEETSLAPDKREALGWLLLHPIKCRRRRGRDKAANRDRDFILAQAVLRAIARSGLPATRNPGTRTGSGAAVVVESLRLLELPPMKESNLNRIWFEHTEREQDRRRILRTVVSLPRQSL
jgi:hypothetical protein